MSIDLNKLLLWNNFKEKVLMALDEAPPFEVDLSFEYKDMRGHVVTYSSGDPVYITDMKLSGYPQLCFEVPNGPESRFITLNYADSISHPELGSLDDFANTLYQQAYEAFELKDQYPANLAKFVSTIGSDEVNVYNNSAQHIKETIQLEKDKKSFGSIDTFGMF